MLDSDKPKMYRHMAEDLRHRAIGKDKERHDLMLSLATGTVPLPIR